MPEDVMPPSEPRQGQDPGEPGPGLPAAPEAEGDWPPPGEVSKDERTMAMLAWLLGAFSWFIGPLVIYLMKKEESKFIAFHALQSLYFQLVSFAIVMVIAVVTCGFGAILGVAPLVVNILWCIKANNGEWAELPVIADWCKK